MANCKLTFAFLAVFVAVVSAGVVLEKVFSDDHNIDQCDPTKAKLRLQQTNIYEPAKFIVPVTRTFTFPESGINTHLITCLKVTNTDSSNHGGYPEVIAGGVGSYDVQIRMKSQWGQPLEFRIEIWAEE